MADNQRLLIGGPEALSLRDGVALYEHVLGSKITVKHATPGASVPGMPDAVAQFLVGFDMFDSPMDTTELTNSFGVRLTSLEELARQTIVSTSIAQSQENTSRAETVEQV
jgi:hypothetical protein